MKAIKLDRKLAYAAGLDAGNRSMRKAGRTAWNEEDYNEASRVVNELSAQAEGGR